LIVAEVELSSPTQEIMLPDWVGAEVSHEARYYNSSLAQAPYSTW
jgi:adenylate cyclase